MLYKLNFFVSIICLFILVIMCPGQNGVSLSGICGQRSAYISSASENQAISSEKCSCSHKSKKLKSTKLKQFQNDDIDSIVINAAKVKSDSQSLKENREELNCMNNIVADSTKISSEQKASSNQDVTESTIVSKMNNFTTKYRKFRHGKNWRKFSKFEYLKNSIPSCSLNSVDAAADSDKILDNKSDETLVRFNQNNQTYDNSDLNNAEIDSNNDKYNQVQYVANNEASDNKETSNLVINNDVSDNFVLSSPVAMNTISNNNVFPNMVASNINTSPSILVLANPLSNNIVLSSSAASNKMVSSNTITAFDAESNDNKRYYYSVSSNSASNYNEKKSNFSINLGKSKIYETLNRNFNANSSNKTEFAATVIRNSREGFNCPQSYILGSDCKCICSDANKTPFGDRVNCARKKRESKN